MKSIKQIILFSVISLLFVGIKSSYGQRYLNKISDQVDSIPDVVYGEAVNYKRERELLYFDFYEADGDALGKRPLFIFAHGGGFTGGSRKWPSIRLMCEKMARRGYAVASISYRVDPEFNLYESDTDKRAMTDAMHDMRSAIRFFKANREKYRIDTSNIFVSGESAGAATAMMAGYVDEQSELKAYPMTEPDNTEGISGNAGYSSDVKSVLCLCGLIVDTLAISSPKDPTLFWAHGTADPLVPFSWAEEIPQRAEHIGLPHQKVVFEGATHCPWYYGLKDWPLYLDSIVNYMSHFMYSTVTGKKAPEIKKALPPLTMANVLQSDMVIQQDKPFKVWGFSKPGDIVRVSADWLEKPQKAVAGTSGAWSCFLDVPRAIPGDFSPHSITVANDDSSYTLKNILIGEVWLCSGQSNMDMVLRKGSGYNGVSDYNRVIAGADYPAIRLFKQSLNFNVTPQDDGKGKWEICSPETAGNFSAVAYFFGRELLEKLNVPVGLVVSAVAAASAESFTPREVLLEDTLLKRGYWDPRKSNIVSQARVDSMGFLTFRRDAGHYIKKVGSPVLSYNGMIHPLTGLSVRGFLWYQGESNYDNRLNYFHLSAAMIKSWRDKFGQGDLPFYFVQIAPYNYKSDCMNELGFFWEAQEELLKLKNTGMALSADVGDLNDIHPADKEPVGKRLARLALNKAYHQKNIADEGPVFSKFKIKKNGDVIVYFRPETMGTGLCTDDGAPPKHFVLAGKDQVFYPASARIKGNKIVLSTTSVRKPVAVRYGFSNDAITNLKNKDGLPAFPFRTDNWTTCFFKSSPNKN